MENGFSLNIEKYFDFTILAKVRLYLKSKEKSNSWNANNLFIF